MSDDSSDAIAPSDAVQARLASHDARRRQGIGTVSVLVGSREGAARHWRRHASQQARDVLVAEGDSPEEVWSAALPSARRLVERATRWVAELLGMEADALLGRLARSTAHDRRRLWEAALAASRLPDVVHLCQALLDGTSIRVEPPSVRALASLAGAEGSPALIWMPSPQIAVSSCAQVLGALARQALQIPSLPVGVVLGGEFWDAATAAMASSREGALIREGLVRVTSSYEDLTALHSEAVEACRRAGESLAASDRARSAAERLLFAALESRAQTRGLFRLNERADFRLRERPVEVDLLGHADRIAIEIDGYFHFLGPEDYRRDRRKDRALQEHGYLVLRFLAADVPTNLPGVLAIIDDALDLRRASRPAAGGKENP